MISPLNPKNPKYDQHLISPYRNTAESVIEIMRIKEMITNLRCFDYTMNSPFVCPKGKVWKRVWGIWMLMLGCKGLKQFSTSSINGKCTSFSKGPLG